jgi:hypothetical protein
MRRATFAILLVLPAALSAQFGNPFHRGRFIPTELPPQAPGIAREMQYRRRPISFQTYSMVEHIVSSGLTNGAQSAWSSFGVGTSAEYRFSHHVSVTGDVTSAVIAGPANTQTAELGLRFRPFANEHRVYPYADARVGYLVAVNSGLSNLVGFDTQIEYMQGYGALAGAGADVRLTRRFSLMSFAGAMRAKAKSYRYDGNPPKGSYPMTIYRFSIGLRYNPVRLVQQTGGDTE